MTDFHVIWIEYDWISRSFTELVALQRVCVSILTESFSHPYFHLSKDHPFCFTFLLWVPSSRLLSSNKIYLGNLLMPFCLGSVHHNHKYDKVKWDLPPSPTLKKGKIRIQLGTPRTWSKRKKLVRLLILEISPLQQSITLGVQVAKLDAMKMCNPQNQKRCPRVSLKL